MIYEANVTVIIVLALIFFAAMCALCYFLGRAEGREQAKEEIERKRTIYTRYNKRKPRIY